VIRARPSNQDGAFVVTFIFLFPSLSGKS